DLIRQQPIQRIGGDALVGDREEEEDARTAAWAERVQQRLGGGGGLRVAGQHAVHPRALALAEDGGEQFQRGHVGVVIGRHAVDLGDRRQTRLRIHYVTAPLAAVERLRAGD